MITTYTLSITEITNGGVPCPNPDVSIVGATGNIGIECTGEEYTITVPDGETPCVSFLIKCEDCGNCPSIVVEKCFCDTVDDCGECENCVSGFCEKLCPVEQCDEGICVDCSDTLPCPGNQECNNGVCECPAGTSLNAQTGLCEECASYLDCEPCEVCQGGDCVPKECITGVCNPEDNTCVECVNSGDCGANECCVNNECTCCPGFRRENGVCVEAPCITDDDCDACEICTDEGCIPQPCPVGQVCDPATNSCITPCVNDCPEGQGCINGKCYPCEQLSCLGVGLLCQYAAGCACSEDDVCEALDCSFDSVSLVWNNVPGVPGTIVNPGLAALQGTWNITAGAVTTSPPIYRNFSFDLRITNGATGTWTLHNTPSSSSPLGTGTQVVFDLTSTGPNLVGFVVKYVESGTGRTALFGIYSNPSLPLDDPNLFNNSQVDFDGGNGTNPTTIGGTAGSLQLCANNGNFSLISATGGAVSGDIVITFTIAGNGCLIAHVTGCGTWDGTAIVQCGGIQLEIPIPEFTRDPANCCDPVDPNCDGISTGFPCVIPAVVNIDLTSRPTFGQNGGGDTELLITADWTSAGLSFLDLFYLNISPGCWSTSGDAQINGGGPLGVSVSRLAVVITLGTDGCVYLGDTCVLQISGCRRLRGEICLEGCDTFEVHINSLGGNNYSASASTTGVTFTWLYATQNSTGVNFTVIPVGGSYNLTLMGTKGACSDVEVLLLTTNISGCLNSLACNYNGLANIPDDSSCCIIPAPTYDCLEGIVGIALSGACSESGAVTYNINGLIYSAGDAVPAGINLPVIPILGGVPCPAAGLTITVPQCYSCNGSDCDGQSPNQGNYNTFAECEPSCGCTINHGVENQACNDGKRRWSITPTGGFGGPYNVALRSSTSPTQIWTDTIATGGTAYTSYVCDGNYIITVSEGALDEDCVSYAVTSNCHDCANDCDTSPSLPCTTLSIDSVSNTEPSSPFCLSGALHVFLHTGQCHTSHSINLKAGNCAAGTGGTPLAGINQNYALDTDVDVILNLGSLPTDGNYKVIVDNGGCTQCFDFAVNCGGELDCNINEADPFTIFTTFNDGSSTTISGTANFTAIGGTYLLRLYRQAGACTLPVSPDGPDRDSLLITVTNPTMAFSLTDSPHPAGTTCWGISLIDQSNSGCIGEEIVSVPPSGPPPSCVPGTILIGLYNSSDELLPVGLLSSFLNTSGGVNVYVQVSNTAVCTVATDDFVNPAGVLVNPSTPFLTGWATSAGSSEDVPITHFNTVDRCVTVTIVNAADDPTDDFDTAAPTGCYAQTTGVVPACACTIPVNVVSYGTLLQELIVDFEATCESQATDLTIIVDEYTDATYTVLDSNLDTSFVSVDLGTYTLAVAQGPVARYIRVRVRDTVLGVACQKQTDFTIPICEGICAEQFVDVPSGTFDLVEATDTTQYIVNLPCDCVAGGGASANNDAVATEIEAELNAVDGCGLAVVTWESLAETTGTCLRAGIGYNGTVASAGDMLFCRVTINGTPYDTSIVFVNYVAGDATETVGAEGAIATFIANSLNTEGVPFFDIEVEVTVSDVAPNEDVDIIILIRGIDTSNVMSFQRTGAGAACPGTSTNFALDCTAVTGTTVVNFRECTRFIVSGSAILLDHAQVTNPITGLDDYLFDDSGC